MGALLLGPCAAYISEVMGYVLSAIAGVAIMIIVFKIIGSFKKGEEREAY